MVEFILATLVGLTIGTVSALFVRSRRWISKLMVVLTAVSGALLFTAATLALGMHLPTPAVAAAGATALLTLRFLFRRPSAGHRNFFM